MAAAAVEAHHPAMLGILQVVAIEFGFMSQSSPAGTLLAVTGLQGSLSCTAGSNTIVFRQHSRHSIERSDEAQANKFFRSPAINLVRLADRVSLALWFPRSTWRSQSPMGGLPATGSPTLIPSSN